MEQIGILGVGNTLLGDDGFGPYCVNCLEQQYIIPDNLHVLDGGTSALFLAPFLDDLDALYVVDAVALKEAPGTIHLFSSQSLCSRNLQSRMSPHQVGLVEILELCQLRGKAPGIFEMITVVPQDVTVRLGLSECLQAQVNTVVDLLVDRVASLGVILKNKYEPECVEGMCLNRTNGGQFLE